MKNYAQCLMCKYVFGRTCKLNNEIINDEIYTNKIKCEAFKSINEEIYDVDDKCCSENARYNALNNK